MNLLGVPSVPTIDSGPGTCMKVRLWYDSGIYRCNDLVTSLSLGSYQDIAYPTDYIHEKCQSDNGVWTVGQFFATDKWNVIVAGRTQAVAEGECGRGANDGQMDTREHIVFPLDP